MGRKRRPKTTVKRIRVSDAIKIQELAKEAGMSFQAYVSMMRRRLTKLK